MEATGLAPTFDLAQIALYVFWVFFAGLVFYLRAEDKREGYPLLETTAIRLPRVGFPTPPGAKRFRMSDGRVILAPRQEPPAEQVNASPMLIWEGSPLIPMGNPMVDGVGPAAWVARADVPEMTVDAHPKILPLRRLPLWSVAPQGPDPRGMRVRALDKLVAGKVTDLWVDTAEMTVRYMEIGLDADGGTRLFPMTLATVDDDANEIKVVCVKSTHFPDAPVTANPDQVSLREEDRICAYFASGHLYADPRRAEPLL